MFLRVLLQWLVIGLILRGLWGLLRVFSHGSRGLDQGRDRTTRKSTEGPRESKPPYDPEDVLDVRYEEVAPKKKSS